MLATIPLWHVRDPTADVATLQAGGAGILVGTPGRLGDILQRCPFLDLRLMEVLVLDEADRLLDLGFRGHIDAIMARLPKQRRTGEHPQIFEQCSWIPCIAKLAWPCIWSSKPSREPGCLLPLG